eukprot:100910_1
MGNINSNHLSQLSKQIKQYRDDHFIVEFSHQYKLNHTSAPQDICLFDDRRLVFVSLVGLFQTYQNCPPHMLHSALFVLPIKRDWLYHISHCTNRDECLLLSSMDSGRFTLSETLQLLRLLRWKDSQHLLFCMLDDHNTKTTDFVHSFWIYLSDMLCHLYDPIHKNGFKPLQFTEQWWRHHLLLKRDVCDEQTAPDVNAIMTELYFLPMRFKTIREIIEQSNPKSLNVVTFYCEKKNMFKAMQIGNDEGMWYISTDYEL